MSEQDEKWQRAHNLLWRYWKKEFSGEQVTKLAIDLMVAFADNEAVRKLKIKDPLSGRIHEATSLEYKEKS